MLWKSLIDGAPIFRVEQTRAFDAQRNPVEVSDTTADAQSDSVGHKKILPQNGEGFI